jgi:chemotaxis protein methyltransferase CheR
VYPSLSNNTGAMDVIFCRNVLMYFTVQRAKQVTGNFYRALVEGGWLIVSPTETSNRLLSSFAPVEFPGAVLYRKKAGAESSPDGYMPFSHKAEMLSAMEPEIADPAQSVSSSIPTNTATFFETQALPQKDVVPTPQGDEREMSSHMARSCANQGRLSEALEWCKKAIEADKMNPSHHYLFATILQEQGQHDIAIQSLTRALYLEPRFVLAHFSLGNLHQSQGRYREAQRHFANTQLLLCKHPQDEILPEADGLTAGRLIEIVTALQASLPKPSAARA